MVCKHSRVQPWGCHVLSVLDLYSTAQKWIEKELWPESCYHTEESNCKEFFTALLLCPVWPLSRETKFSSGCLTTLIFLAALSLQLCHNGRAEPLKSPGKGSSRICHCWMGVTTLLSASGRQNKGFLSRFPHQTPELLSSPNGKATCASSYELTVN